MPGTSGNAGWEWASAWTWDSRPHRAQQQLGVVDLPREDGFKLSIDARLANTRDAALLLIG